MRLGILVDDLGPSQLAYHLIRNGNNALKDGILEDLVVFYESLSAPCLTPHFACMQLAEAWGYPGTLMATSEGTAAWMARAVAAERKLFYVWDLSWLRGQGPQDFRQLHSVYGAPSVSLIARGAEHAAVLSGAWNRPVLGVVDDFDIRQLLEVL